MRLTKWKWFRTNRRLYRANNEISISDLTWKLGQLEDIEDELGIDLEIIFKALKNGVWIKDCSGQICKSFVSIYNLNLDVSNPNLHLCFITAPNYKLLYLFEDYGKDWALTKEELL